MIESRVRPDDGVMALTTQRRWETSGDVVWHVAAKGWRAIPGGLMATIAVGVCGGKIIVVIDVAVGALIDLASRRELV